jgi:hypothetical protein
MAKVKLDVAKIKEIVKTRQEVLALVGACVLAVLCLVSGMSKWLSASSPDAEIQKDAEKIRAGRDNAPRAPAATDDPKGDPKGSVPPGPASVSQWLPVTESEAKLSMKQPFFEPGAAGDARRFSPQILPIEEFQLDYLRRGIFTYTVNGSKLTVFDPGATGGELEALVNVEGKRMVVVSGAFPYSAEVEKYRKALRLETMEDVFAQGLAPTFAGLNVQRRKIAVENGKDVPGEWEAVYVADPFTGQVKAREPIERLMVTAVYDEREADKYYDVIFGSAATPLPLLSSKAEYPEITLKGIAKRQGPAPAFDQKFEMSKKGMIGGGGKGAGRGAAMPPLPPVPLGPGAMGQGPGAGGNPSLFPKQSAQPRQTVAKDASELPSPLQERLLGKFNFFSPDGVPAFDPDQVAEDQPAPGGEMVVPPPQGPPGGRGMKGGGARTGEGGIGAFGETKFGPKIGMPTNPMALVRFVDVDVEPGATYQYRVQVRMVNPNYKQSPKIVAHAGLAKLKELVSPEWAETAPIQIPGDFLYYLVNHNPKIPFVSKQQAPKGIDSSNGSFTAEVIGGKQVPFQVHRFLDSTAGDKNEVGDWVVAERLLVARGEAIGRECEVEAVQWVPTKATWELARGMQSGKPKATPPGVMVNFRVEPSVILLDFIGGIQKYPKPGSKREDKMTVSDENAYTVLLLLPDGTMAIRRSRDDTDERGWAAPEDMSGNPVALERRLRYEEWKSRIDSIRNPANQIMPGQGVPGGKKGGGGGGG